MDRGKMGRLRPERRPRQRVQKVWRSVCWADSFSDESLTMDTLDITPDFALRKIATLFENKKYDECASLIRRFNGLMLQAILREVPVDMIHEALPHSATMLEALYVRVYQTYPEDFPTAELNLDHLVKVMVCILARHYNGSKGDKNSNTFLPSFRRILRIILTVQPQFRRQIIGRKKQVDRCLKHLGHHGMVDSSSGGRLMSLHDALKLELEKVVVQYKCALQKLHDLSLSAKHPTGSSVTSGKAPTNASHQRLMQVTRSDVQNRLIKNKTLLNAVESAICNEYLSALFNKLERRIEYDKGLLFQDTELRRTSGIATDDVFLSITLRQLSQGHGALLGLMREIAGDDTVDVSDGITSSDDELLDTHRSVTLHKSHRVVLNGKAGVGIGPTGSSGVRSLEQTTSLQGNGIRRGRESSYRTPSVGEMSTSFPCYDGEGGPSPVDPSGPSSLPDMDSLQREVDQLRRDLVESNNQIKKMERREGQLKERLSDQVHKQFVVNSGGFENVSLGSKRPTELIRQYANLYTDGRVDAMDALSGLSALGDLHILKMKILFSVIVLAFRAAQHSLQDLRLRLRQMLNIPPPDATSGNLDPMSRDLERHLDFYLSQTAERFDLSKCVQDVCTQIYATLYDYPCLKDCPVLVTYIRECVRLAWGLSVLNPPYIIVYDTRTFSPDCHTRFHTSCGDSGDIQCFLWPSLLEQETGAIMHKGVVIT